MHKSKENYPLMIEPAHIQEILSIGRKRTYEFIAEIEINANKGRPVPFHIKRIGKLYKINRDSFFKWLDGEQDSVLPL